VDYTKPIFEKASIRGLADYILYGLAPNKDTRDYETRLDDVYEKYKKAVFNFDDSPTPELLDLANEMTEETASVYMEIGIQTGILLMLDIIKNTGTKELSNLFSSEVKEQGEAETP